MSQPGNAAPHAAGGGSVIHDIGYQRYTGPRLGAAYATRSLYVHSLRSAFGLGRIGKGKAFPWAVVGINIIVAAIIAAIESQSPVEIRALTYAAFPDSMSILTLLFVAIIAPELISRDLRNRVLPLYFSRPLSRAQYPLAKLAGLVTAIWLVLAAPQLIMFLGRVLTDRPGRPAVSEEIGDLLGAWGYSAIHAVLYASLGLVIASMASRRAFASGAIIGVFLASGAFFGVLSEVLRGDSQNLAGIVSPFSLLIGLREALFDENLGVSGEYGGVYYLVTLALVVISVVATLVRYRKVAA